MSAIFISHSSQDNTIAAEVKLRLAEQGHRSVFLDFDPEDGIPAGRNWERELYARLRACQAVIVLCSEHSMNSRWCFAEITQARSLGKHLFPLKVAPCIIPSLLGDVQVIDHTTDQADTYPRLGAGLKLAGLNPADLFDWDGSRPPYPGLMAFQEEDAAVYFGRDRFIQDTIETLNRLQRFGGPRLVLVLGASGSGKSSLVRAGVVPRIKRDSDRWLVLEPFRPLGRPVDELAMVLASAFRRFGETRDWRSIRDMLSAVDEGNASAFLRDIADDLRVAANQREAVVLLILDQVEELLGKDTDRSTTQFLHLVQAVLGKATGPFLALGTLRSDFLGAFQIQPAIADLPYEPILLPPMALQDFAQVIEGPAHVAGIELDPGLAQAMVADTATEDALPLLAFTLRELWERYAADGRLTLEEYRAGLGGLKGSVARAAEIVYVNASLSPDQERHVHKAFLSMVWVDEEGRYARRPTYWAELPEDVHDLLERFVRARLLVSRSEGGERIVEVAHEALFRSWERLVAWLNTDREFLLWQQRLRGDLAEWERTGHDEGTLLRGPLLVEADRWHSERPDDLSPAAQEFIRQSLEERDRQEKEKEARRQREIRRAWTIAGGSLVALLVTALLGLMAFSQWTEAQKRSILTLIQSARANMLANQQLEAMIDAIRAEQQRHHLLLGGEEVADQVVGILIWSINEIQEHNRWRVEHKQWQANILPNKALWKGTGNPMYTVVDRGIVTLWDTSGKPVATIDTQQDLLSSLAFSPDRQQLATGGYNGTIKRWDASGKLIDTFPHDKKGYASVAFSPDGRWLATSIGVNSPVTLWDVTGNPTVTINPEQDVVFDIAFSPDSQRLATAGFDGTAKLWSVFSGSPIATINTGERRLWRVAFTPDGQRLGTYSHDDNTTKLWNLMGREIASITTGPRSIPELAFGPHGLRLATVGDDFKVKLWDPNSNLITTLNTVQDDADIIAFSPDGQRLATRSVDGKVKLWDASGKLLDTIDFQKGNIHMAFSPHGPWLATVGDDFKVRLWNAKGNLIATLNTVQDDADIIAFSPDGQRLATIGRGGKVKLWDAKGNFIATPNTQQADVYTVTFSPNGQSLATGGGDGTVQLWDVTRNTITTIYTQQGNIDDLKFSPNGRWLVTCSQHTDKVKLWDARGNLIATLNTHQADVYRVAFSPDGQTLATGGDGRVKLWQIGGEKELLIRGCNELWDYLHNPSAVLSDSDRRLCDGIGTQK